MKLLKRNMTEFEYLPYDGTETDLNESGEHTGEFHQSYGSPVKMKGNISSPSGYVNPTFYGADIRYTHILIMDQPDPGINEYGLIRWKGEMYEVRAVRPSLNALSVALRKQTVDHEDPYVPDGEDE